MMSLTPSPRTAYSIVAASPHTDPGVYGGTRLPALRRTNRSPGSAWQIRSGTIRESEQAMNSACGFCPSASLRNMSSRARKTSDWNL